MVDDGAVNDVLDFSIGRSWIRARFPGVEREVAFDDVNGCLDAAELLLGSSWERTPAAMRVRADQLGLVALDVHGEVVAPILWAEDDRSKDDAVWCNKKYPANWWIERIGEIPRPELGVTKLSWLHRSEPDAWKQMRSICGIEDLLRWHVGGSASGELTTTSDFLRSMGISDPTTGDVHPDILELIDSERSWDEVLPRTALPGTRVGTRHGIPIVV